MTTLLESNVMLRAKYTVIMVAILTAIAMYGHIPLIASLATIQVCAFKETMAISRAFIASNTILSWYLFTIAMFYTYGANLCYYFTNIVPRGGIVHALAAKYHRFLSLMLYTASFVFFVRNAKLDYVKSQILHFVLTHFAIMWLVGPGHLAMQAMFEGLIWFLLPITLVAVNDIAAYVCGKLFGRTPLLKISPKKTREGCLGAWVVTLISSIAITWILTRNSYFTCAGTNLGSSFFTGLSCDESPVFTPRALSILGHNTRIPPIYIHALVLATFASLVAPFGGFFASSVKRSLGIKDFGNVIPGHGGVMDRIDCQLFMMVVACAYYQAFVFVGSRSVMARLGQEEKMDLVVESIAELLRSGVGIEDILKRVRDVG